MVKFYEQKIIWALINKHQQTRTSEHEKLHQM